MKIHPGHPKKEMCNMRPAFQQNLEESHPQRNEDLVE